MTTRLSLVCFAIVTAAVLAAPGPLAPGDPVAFVVAVNGYAPPQKKLEHAVPNGVTLTKKLVGLGYKVTVVCDKASKLFVEKELEKLAGVLVIHAVDEGDELERVWRKWTDENFLTPIPATRPPLGIVAFGGHAEFRREDVGGTYFLAAKDPGGTGGIRVEGLQDYCAIRNLPIVMLMDVCRTELKPPPPVIEVRKSGLSPSTLLTFKNRGNRLGFAEERGRPLTLWSTAKGSAAVDSPKDLLKMLALGLDEVMGQRAKTFQARKRLVPNGDLFTLGERETDLSLYAWFRGAIVLETGSADPQSYQIDVGSVDQQMVFASTDRVRQKKLLALANSRTDLLEAWTNVRAGDFEDKRTWRGLEVTRSDAGGASPYVYSLIRGDHDTTNKTILIECVAISNGAVVAPGQTLKVLFQPFGIKDYSYSDSRTVPKEIPFGRPVLVRIPLDVGTEKKLTRMGFADINPSSWPKGVSLLVTRMDLCGNQLAKEIPEPHPDKAIDLLSRWWVADVLREEGSAAKMVIKRQQGKDSFPLLFTGTEAKPKELYGRGGAVFPKVYVDTDVHALEIQLGDCGKVAQPNSPSVYMQV
jgi:hypothetical protein